MIDILAWSWFGQVIAVKQTFVHPLFDKMTAAHDLAVLELASDSLQVCVSSNTSKTFKAAGQPSVRQTDI